MMKKLLCVLLCWALLPCFAAPVWAAPVTVPAESAVLMEKETGTVLYAQNEHVPLAPASVTSRQASTPATALATDLAM